MKNYVAYIRVSTARQGEKGSSLPEQKAVIEAYAKREGMTITRWYEERETAAKVGRTQFVHMLRALRRGEAHGLLLHKIDRGARNLKDWADLSQLSDQGIDVRIAGDTLDLTSRGGRLSADIQAVVAADFIRNLRDEVKKGQRGRLKQGLYPWNAPLGYVNNGGTEPKTIDPVAGPLVRRAFEAYATGSYTLRTLRLALFRFGLKTKGGKPLSLNALNKLLRRKFYYGLIVVRKESYVGAHTPLISKALFDAVATMLAGRSAVRVYRESPYVLQRLLRCAACDRHLYAEMQKGRAYYRCHSDGCQGTSLRESDLVERLLADIGTMELSDETLQGLTGALETKRRDLLAGTADAKQGLVLRLDQVKDRLARLTDAYLDRAIDKADFDARKETLHDERLAIEHDLAHADHPERGIDERAKQFLELIKSLQDLGETATGSEMRAVLKSAISNCAVRRKDVAVQWKVPLQLLLAREGVLIGDPTGNRTFIERDGCNSIKIAMKRRSPYQPKRSRCSMPTGPFQVWDFRPPFARISSNTTMQ